MVAPLSTTMCPRRCNASRLERDMGLLAFAVRIRVRSCFDKPIVRISSEKLTVLLLDQLSCSAQLACSIFNRLTEGRTPWREYPMDDLVPCLCVLDSVCASGVSIRGGVVSALRVDSPGGARCAASEPLQGLFTPGSCIAKSAPDLCCVMPASVGVIACLLVFIVS